VWALEEEAIVVVTSPMVLPLLRQLNADVRGVASERDLVVVMAEVDLLTHSKRVTWMTWAG
jgi:hypothetical protein